MSSKTLDADAPNPGANLHAHSWYVEPASPFSSNSLAAVRVLTRVSSAEDTHFLHHEQTEVGRDAGRLVVALRLLSCSKDFASTHV